MYASKKILKGFLIDEGIEMRDFFSAQVIITTLGGGRKLDPETQKMIRVADAADRGAPLESINAAWRNGLLVGMLAGSSNPLFMERCVPPHTYNVLDWFHITYIWKERVYTPEGRLLALWKMRFEKADLRKPSWWDRNGYHATATPETREAPLAGCLTCKKTSKTIYADGWTCLNNRCSQYYASLENLGFDNLRYSEEFLKERTAFSGELPPLMPDLAARLSSDNHGTNLDARRGFVCPDCGCCSRRLYWSKLVCENSDCGRSWITPIHEYPRELLDRDERKFNQRMARSLQGQGWDTAVEKVVNRRVIKEPTDFTFGSYQARAYKLPDADGNIIGTFTLFRSNSEINKAAGGPDSMFRELGMADIGLKRNVSAAPGSKVEGLCRHFSQNFGARYKFGVAVQSKGFDEAPPTILRALHRLIWASEGAVSMTPQLLTGENPSEHTPPLAMEHSFNELLALGYMERDQINFHDDGESELGPTVAAISLGSPSIMKFRPKSKLDFTRLGAKRTGREEEENGSRDYKSVLEVAFRHGDIMVMHGAHIHRLYEHDVEPLGDRRFSLTSRYIDPSKMEHQADRDDAAIKGRIPEESFIYSYNDQRRAEAVDRSHEGRLQWELQPQPPEQEYPLLPSFEEQLVEGETIEYGDIQGYDNGRNLIETPAFGAFSSTWGYGPHQHSLEFGMVSDTQGPNTHLHLPLAFGAASNTQGYDTQQLPRDTAFGMVSNTHGYNTQHLQPFGTVQSTQGYDPRQHLQPFGMASTTHGYEPRQPLQPGSGAIASSQGHDLHQYSHTETSVFAVAANPQRYDTYPYFTMDAPAFEAFPNAQGYGDQQRPAMETPAFEGVPNAEGYGAQQRFAVETPAFEGVAYAQGYSDPNRTQRWLNYEQGG
ncbi:hypothetical protein QBC47DRAFT_374919 [Echria macrotheca]|uniref:Alpha-ketoglutarate-dependent dioxygenase AlkB-like domain-containing protein n=1 Tax=Echria macrotheca TaxID=438768 RepID=A0AAJ0BHS0_9PEZI|nr:hypothetical protein QBC47DRAFT_374919 [Echria macrotheca]